MNEYIDWKKDVLPILEEIKDKGVSTEILRKLFIEKLNYDFSDLDLSIKYPDSIKDSIYTSKIISEKSGFKIIFCKIEKLLKGIELPVVKIISSYYTANLIAFTNKECNEVHFINTKYIGKERDKKVKGFRRITVGKTDRLRTAAERLSKIYADDGISESALMAKCEEAFNVEAVSKEFYKEFVNEYKNLRKIIIRKNKWIQEKEADRITQEIFNRLLFLYFVQKKGWLNYDSRFLYNNFKKLEESNKEYYKKFLIPLFKKLSDKNFQYKGFENIPFLNGGLFEFQKIEERISIPNSAFNEIFENLLERFNFTIREDTEFEEEVAIDPEMLGKIFEELILAAESEEYEDIPDPRSASGSYYTPRFVVSFMVKQSIYNYLIDELPEIPREKLKALIFKPDEESSINNIDFPDRIKNKLINIRVVDPGVGSGAFAVEMLNKIVQLIDIINKVLNIEEDRFTIRKKIIEDCIYGVDIQERAVHLARLRLWLSLIVDLDSNDIKDIPPLINLDFKIVKGDSLVSKICGHKFDLRIVRSIDQKITNLIDNFKRFKDSYSEENVDKKKKRLKEKINRVKSEIAIWHLKNIKKVYKSRLFVRGGQQNLFNKDEDKTKRRDIEKAIKDIDKNIRQIKRGEGIDAFNWYLDFFEVMGEREGFDIVIANPPYGVDVNKEVYENEFGLGSKDSYGVFTALGLNILKPNGILCYIMSDTWQTIRTHYKLRERLYQESECSFLISVPMKTFNATVNTGIYLFRKSAIDKEKDNFIIAADFHNLDIKRGDLEAAFDLITGIQPDEKCQDGYTIISDREMAIYVYRQKIIESFSNLSFFIASPKLFKLVQDVGNKKPKVFTNEKGELVLFDVEKQQSLFEQQVPDVYEVNFNGKILELMKLGDIAEVVVGLQTGDNDYYLRQLPETRGSYKEVDLSLVLKENEIDKIRKDENLRIDVIENGICTNPEHKTHQHRYFGGRYFVPYDKGGESDIEEGWLPNYYVPTPYFIDWSETAVRRLKTWKKPGTTKIASRFQNKEFYFKEGITFSITGVYAPLFRKNSGSIFDVKGSGIYSLYLDNDILLEVLNSLFIKYFNKNYIQHSVDFQVDEVKKIPIVFNIAEDSIQKLTDLVSSIIQNQRQNPRYDYMTKEQIEIDKLVYQMYNLNEEDIKEVENWYFRRYPKLAKIIEEKLSRKNNDNK